MDKKALTLVEIMIVVTILAIL
ncbi:MAG: prepilin-type N-terminal cleavage/methylation domain-containing protein [Candidatus Peribacteria bacterium]|nr:prepilin-type N-terminal cleavage/methylation domain-containing protein [Candidatus Peribacteria bacterium]